jgi:LysM repeat protein
MKFNSMVAMLSVLLASPAAFADSELETLRIRCNQQQRQILQLEHENTKLRSSGRETNPGPAKQENFATKTETITTAATGPSYTVKKGDNFDKIARKIGTSPQRLAKANGLTPNSIIRPGQKLKVPGSTTAPAAPAVAAASSPTPSDGRRTHTMKQGETFTSVSRKYGIKVSALIAANPKAKPSSLRPGQVINLGGRSTSTVAAIQPKAPVEKKQLPEETPPTPTQTPKSPAVAQNIPASKPTPAAAAPAIPDTKSVAQATASTQTAEKEKQPPAAASQKKIHAVTIDGEMTYGEFAAKHGTDAERLNALNGLDLTTATVLAKGSELYVPAQP